MLYIKHTDPPFHYGKKLSYFGSCSPFITSVSVDIPLHSCLNWKFIESFLYIHDMQSINRAISCYRELSWPDGFVKLPADYAYARSLAIIFLFYNVSRCAPCKFLSLM